MVDIDKVRAQLKEAVENKPADIPLHSKEFGVMEESVTHRSKWVKDNDSIGICPIGCLLLGTEADPQSSLIHHAAKLLDVNTSEVWSFIDGFDDVLPIKGSTPMYQLGAEFREEYLS